MTSSRKSQPAVRCPEHGFVVLPIEQYQRQLAFADARWTCPECGVESEWAGTGDYE